MMKERLSVGRQKIVLIFSVMIIFGLYQNCGTKKPVDTLGSNATAVLGSASLSSNAYNYTFPSAQGAAPFSFVLADSSSSGVAKNIYVVTSFPQGGFTKVGDTCNGTNLSSGQNCTISVSCSTGGRTLTGGIVVQYQDANGMSMPSVFLQVTCPANFIVYPGPPVTLPPSSS